MPRWHTEQIRRSSGLDGMRDFDVSGALVSIGREPPQNSTDNPNRTLTGKPVKMRYSIREISDPLLLSKYLPQNPWADHISSPDNSDVVDSSSVSQHLRGSPIRVLVIEDFNTTGIIGDPKQYLPTYDGNDYDSSTRENTFYWFLRAIAQSKPSSGRGGSWGLGKLAAPLASNARTFFCVTKQFDTGNRYLVGQSVVKQHQRLGITYEAEMYFADEKLQDPDNLYSWSPISDDSEIGEFCNVFGVDRSDPGTSLVIPFTKDDEFGSVSEINEIATCIIANWAVPILDGRLEMEFVNLDGKSWSVNPSHLRRLIHEGHLSWDSSREKIGSKPNPAWSSCSRLSELIALVDSKTEEGKISFEVKTPSTERNYARSPSAQISELVPSQDDQAFIDAREAFQNGEFIHVHGSIPVWTKENEQLGDGKYSLILHKTGQESAEAHFYRDQISLPLVLNKGCVWGGVSSLMEVSGEDNLLAQMLRDSEGPAHLEWNPQEPKFRRKYKHPSTTITFLRDLGKKIAEMFHSVESDDEALWDDIFSIGGGGSSRTSEPEEFDVDRNLRISELEENGFSIAARAHAPDLTGNEYILRVGYPVPFATKWPKRAPDPRSINIHEMDWFVQGAELKEYAADDGEICYDRYVVSITESDFLVEMTGLDSRLKAQVIVQLSAEEVVE